MARFDMETFASSPDGEVTLYQLMLNDIADGHITDGHRLNVVELVKRYGVSISPVRDVPRRMQAECYVDISHSRGATMRKTDADARRSGERIGTCSTHAPRMVSGVPTRAETSAQRPALGAR